MPTTSSKTFLEGLEGAVQLVIDKEIKRISEEVEEEAVKRLKQRIAQVVAGVGIQMAKRISFESMKQEILIHVSMEDKT